MKAVNVVEVNEGVVYSNRLFTGEDADKKAEELFTSIVKEMDTLSITALDACLDDGYYQNGDWAVCITHPEVA